MELLLIFAMGLVCGWMFRDWCLKVKKKFRRTVRYRTYRVVR
jgi:hypothetical protein